VQAAQDAGVYGIKPLDFSNTPALIKSLQDRLPASLDVMHGFNVPWLPFSQSEVRQFGQFLKVQSVEGQRDALRRVLDCFRDPEMLGVALEQLSAEDSSRALAVLFMARDRGQANQGKLRPASWGGPGGFDVAQAILTGQTAIDAASAGGADPTQPGKRGVALPDEAMLRQAVLDFSAGRLNDDPGKLKMLTDAIRAIAVGIQLRYGGVDGGLYKPEFLRAAARAAVGQGEQGDATGIEGPGTESVAQQVSTNGQLPDGTTLRKMPFVIGKDEPVAYKTGQIDTHYDKTAALGILSGLPGDWALRIARHTQYRDDDPDFRPLNDANLLTTIWSAFTNAEALKKHHFVLSDPVTGKVPEYLKKTEADGKVHDLRPPDGKGTVLGEMWDRITETINNPEASKDQIADVIGDYLHAFQDTFTHRDENNVPIDAVRNLGPWRLGIGHAFYGVSPDLTSNHTKKRLIGKDVEWNVNEERNLKMDEMVYEKLKLIGDMLREKKNVAVGDAKPWAEDHRGALEVLGKPRDVREFMDQFNKQKGDDNQVEFEKDGSAEHRRPEEFKNKRKLIDNTLRDWNYRTANPDGVSREYEFSGPSGLDIYKWVPPGERLQDMAPTPQEKVSALQPAT